MSSITEQEMLENQDLRTNNNLISYFALSLSLTQGNSSNSFMRNRNHQFLLNQLYFYSFVCPLLVFLSYVLPSEEKLMEVTSANKKDSRREF
jgi:hypothetical protein